MPHTNHLEQPIGDVLPNWTPPPLPARERLEGHFCRIEPLDADQHAEQLYAADALDAEGRGWTYLAYGPFDSFASYHAWVDTVSQRPDPLFFAIVDQTSGHAVGVASYLRIMPEHGSIEVGHIHFSPLLQRTPAATEAMYLMMHHAFALGYRRYEWKCDALNAPSRAAAQRLGFRYEGTFRQATIYKHRSRDTAWYAVIDRDWPPLNVAFMCWLDPANFDADGTQRARLPDLIEAIRTPKEPTP